MQKSVVLTITGTDRTGLVESLAKLIADSRGSWMESRMCSLGGKFAGILRILVPEPGEETLIRSIENLKSEGLSVVIYPDRTLKETASQHTRTVSLSLVGQHRPGIIYQISSALAHQKVNVQELETECTSAPMSGEMIFRASATLEIPDTCRMSELRRELEEIGSELMVDISFSES